MIAPVSEPLPDSLSGMLSDSLSTFPDRPEAVSRNGSRDISAALLAALFQALGHCPPDRRSSILNALEARLGGTVDDLAAKLESLLKPGTPARDQIQGLWLLYLSLVAQPHGDVQIWIGPDVFSDDVENHLRLHLPGGASATFRPDLSEELETLAQTITKAAQVTLRRSGPGQIVVVLHDATSPT